MKCAKSKVICNKCEKQTECQIYKEYLIETSIQFKPLTPLEIFPHGDTWIGFDLKKPIITGGKTR